MKREEKREREECSTCVCVWHRIVHLLFALHTQNDKKKKNFLCSHTKKNEAEKKQERKRKKAEDRRKRCEGNENGIVA